MNRFMLTFSSRPRMVRKAIFSASRRWPAFSRIPLRPPRLEPDVGAYELGPDSGRSFYLSPMAGTVCLRDNGIDFRPSDGALIRVAWRGSSEVGDWRPTREALAKFNELGIAMPEHEKPGVILPAIARARAIGRGMGIGR